MTKALTDRQAKALVRIQNQRSTAGIDKGMVAALLAKNALDHTFIGSVKADESVGPFVIVNTETLAISSLPTSYANGTKPAKFDKIGPAKATLTRLRNKITQLTLEGKALPWYCSDFNKLEIMSLAEYDNMDTMVERVNLVSGETYMEDINTPRSCSPASELYWSM